VKTSIFSKYKRQKHVLDLPSFMTATRSRFIPLGIKINNNIAYILVGAFRGDGTLLQEVLFQALTGLSLIAK
jgi:hypothetical protein